MTTDDSSHFSRESARERFLSTYDDLLRRLWPVPVQAEDIPTAAGTVRVYRSGPAGDDPVVLLAGAGGNALGWHPCVAALSNSRPVIAVDPLGEPGRSVQTQPIPDAAGAIDGWTTYWWPWMPGARTSSARPTAAGWPSSTSECTPAGWRR